MKIWRTITVLCVLLAGTGICQADTIKWTTNKKGQKVYYNTIAYSKEYKKYEKLIATISKRHGVSAKLVKAVIQVESNYDHRVVSKAGAIGLMQLMPDTAERFGVGSAYEPAQNIEGGVKYLKYLLKLFNSNTKLALAAYNAGEGTVARAKGIPKYVETQNYVRKVLALYSGEMKYIPYTGI
jgi:soluble lytic murein transglycosylase-like protein